MGEKFKFRLIKQRFQDARDVYNKWDADFFLERDRWDDFGYTTTYHLHLTSKHTGDGIHRYLGPIRIMEIGQRKDDIYLLDNYIDREGCISEVPQDFVAMSDSLDLFKGIANTFKLKERQLLINSLHIILDKNSHWYELVKEEPCFIDSLCRETDLDYKVFAQIRDLLFSDGFEYNLRKQTVIVNYPQSSDSIQLDFSCMDDDEQEYPNGLIAFIGKNGSGKSHFLYTIANLLYASPSERSYLKEFGSLSPEDILIRKLIVLSYTPFDSFLLPGQGNRTNVQAWLQSLNSHEGRFEFCGLRDVKREAEQYTSKKNDDDLKGDKEIDEADKLTEWEKGNLHANKICLKDISALGKESFEAFNHLEHSEKSRKSWRKIVRDFSEYGHENLALEWLKLADVDNMEEWTENFNLLSTGHKFFFHSILSIIAYIEENSLLLFDEPENHLQSPLLSFMIWEIQKILYQNSSVMLIATHSPIILQCIMSQNIRIVNRDGDRICFRKPSIETFGESFGAISSEVFDMTSDRNNFYNSLDLIYEKGTNQNNRYRDASEAVDFVRNKMHGISLQGINYIVEKFFNDNVEG